MVKCYTGFLTAFLLHLLPCLNLKSNALLRPAALLLRITPIPVLRYDLTDVISEESVPATSTVGITFHDVSLKLPTCPL